jgi:hypothetical protein
LEGQPKDYLSTAKTAALAIYAIRNKLFHGNFDPGSDIDQQHIEIAEHLLAPLLKEIIAWQILGHALPTMRFATEHKLTF